MKPTLFQLDDPPPPLKIIKHGYMRAKEITPRITKIDQKVETLWHLDVESFSESLEQVQKYCEEWDSDEGAVIVRVTIEAEEPTP